AQAVVGASIAHSQSERCDLGFGISGRGIDARSRRLTIRGNSQRTEPFYHAGFDAPDHLAHAELRTLEIHQQINDELAGSVICDLSAAIDLEHRNAVVAQHVLASSC